MKLVISAHRIKLQNFLFIASRANGKLGKVKYHAMQSRGNGSYITAKQTIKKEPL